MASSNGGAAGQPTTVSRVARWVLRGGCVAAIVATAVVLLLTGYLLFREAQWLPAAAPPPQGPAEEATRRHQAFFHGTIGTEVVPLPVLKALRARAPEHFQPLGREGAGDWVRQFGFIPSERAPVAHPGGESLKGLPLGFTLSHYRPRSGAPSPVKFVGLACATCHTSLIHRPDGTTFLVVGTGNTALNLFAWLDAFQAALLDEEKLTVAAVAAEHEKTNPALSLEERAMIAVWLQGARAKLREDAPKYDLPYGGRRSMDADLVPTGPGRTQPFRTLVRNVLHRPGATMRVYTKIATVFWQDLEAGWGQFDGGIHGLHRRSSGAAFAAGATVQNMNLPEIADNIRWASDYLKDLKGPRWEDVFPDRPVDAAKANLGKSVYLAHCNRCHGHPEGRAEALRWVKGELQGELTPLDQIRTDPERVTFRYYEELPDVLAGLFPKGHEFDFPRDELRPRPGDPTRGYLNKPLHSVFSRGPYLHNASVLTLKELIHLEDRRPVFFRGANPYDIEALGLWSPREGDPKAGTPPFYFRFDTRAAGNSNRGHDYPWRRQDVQQDTKKQADLENLLEYLKTL